MNNSHSAALKEKSVFKRWFIRILIITLVILIGLAIIYRKSIAIRYHLHMMNYANQKIISVGDDYSRQSKYIKSSDYHRDVLVFLDYYQYREFPLSFPSASTLQYRRLWEEIGAVFHNPNIYGHGYDGALCKIVIWETPETIAKLQKLINAHDSPPSNIISILDDMKMEDAMSYVGQWAVEGEVGYIITHIPNLGLKIETPTNDPNDTIKIVSRNLRWQDNKIKFDSFCYFLSSEDYKTITNQYGDHPFSGVRLETIMEIFGQNPDELLVNVRTFQTPESIKAVYKKVKKP